MVRNVPGNLAVGLQDSEFRFGKRFTPVKFLRIQAGMAYRERSLDGLNIDRRSLQDLKRFSSRQSMPHATKRLHFLGTEVICYLGRGGKRPIQSWYRPFFQVQEP